MNKKTKGLPATKKRFNSKRIDFVGIAQGVIFSGLLAVGSFGLVQQVHAAQTIAQYCSKYTGDNKNACENGANGGTDCEDYLVLIDDQTAAQKAADVCKQAVKDRGTLESGNTTSGSGGGSGSNSGTSSGGTSSSSGSSGSSDSEDTQGLQDIQNQNQTENLSDYIDQLHEFEGNESSEVDMSKNELPTNDIGYYVNGGGKKQPIYTLVPGSGSSPVILFFNGGGWLTNDCTGERVAKVTSPRCPTIENDGAQNPASHGYAMLDVTYRLGTSGVYYQYEDVMRGIKHVHDNAKLYGIDPNKMVIWGDSAGGSLVMRAAASGKSGAKAAVGWSAPTNAYTVLFYSIADLAIGIAHSTCVPTDLAGLANFADLANGGSGDVAEYGDGLSSNDFGAIGINGDFNPTALLSQAYVAGNNLTSAAKDLESVSSGIIGPIKGSDAQSTAKNIFSPSVVSSLSSLTSSAFNIASKKFGECIDNFNVLSPALYASPDTPPSYLAEFENDGIVGPDQAYGMRDKLRELGIKTQAVVLPGSQDCIQKSPDTFGTGCHLGYYPAFLCTTINFIDSVVQPERGLRSCDTQMTANSG